MFTPFFYILKAKGLDVSLTEWVTLMDALDRGLCGASLTNFYYLGRMILVKSETDFDKYDRAFQEYFKGIKSSNEVPPQIMEWLDTSGEDEERTWDEENDVLYKKDETRPDEEEIRRRFRDRLD
ncbi:MAG: VWA containing CoxE family protein, partial [Oscillospiraceae bacterium]|nr:VWA containing CoxE family protein [Oscillospiraceae bacterium]